MNYTPRLVLGRQHHATMKSYINKVYNYNNDKTKKNDDNKQKQMPEAQRAVGFVVL